VQADTPETSPLPPAFLAGVIEGFYGTPWSPAERVELFDWMARWGLNTYLYAPKDDLKHRLQWREPYSPPEAETLGKLIRACQQRRLRFVFALSPGLDFRYRDAAELERLAERWSQMLALGVQDFALLFDDIPDRLDPEDLRPWGSLAAAQSHVATTVWRWTRERAPDASLLFCPTAYCGRMAERQTGGPGYLETLGRQLAPEIHVLWTGPEIVSRELTLPHVRAVTSLLRRKPLIWDNLHANDYDGHRFFCGPYSGRPPELRQAVAGLLSNPNVEFPLNYVPLRTLAQFIHTETTWDSRRAYLSALAEWLPRFALVGAPLTREDIVFLADCYYLPHEEGPKAEAFYQRTRDLLAREPARWGVEADALRQEAARLHHVCERLPALRDRPLFHALNRRVWELREELALLDRYVAARSADGQADQPCRSDFHLPGTYRGGLVARLQRLLSLAPDGTFSPAVQQIEPRTPPLEGARTADQ
jgi:protein O-GlcNAcase/histone acetyltransferase